MSWLNPTDEEQELLILNAACCIAEQFKDDPETLQGIIDLIRVDEFGRKLSMPRGSKQIKFQPGKQE